MSKEREVFLLKLKKYLKKLPKEEIDNVLSYYSEYLDDAGVENEANTLATFESPYKIASQIIAEYAVKDMQTAPTAKKVFSTGWVVLLAVCASPVAVPLALALACLAFSLVLVVFCILLSLAVVAISFVATGIICIALGLCLVIQNIASTMFYAGSGLFLLGAGVMFSLLVIYLSKKAMQGIANMISKCLPRRSQK